jgi:hypothetical protein
MAGRGYPRLDRERREREGGSMIQKQRGPGGHRGHTQAGGLRTWEGYRIHTLRALRKAHAVLARYAQSTDEPAWRAVIAADLLDAALSALDGEQ